MTLDLSKLDDNEIVRLFGQVMTELRERGITRSDNPPIADIAERLVASYYNGTVAESNTRSYDVITPDGKKLQVKALRRTKPGRTALGALRSHDFEALVAVVFKPDFEVEVAYYIPLSVVEDYQGWSNTWKASRLSLTKKLCADPRVTTIPAEDLLGTG